MKRQRLIPFRFTPASWGLSGQAHDEAEAAYYLDGEDYARRLVDIRCAGNTMERTKQNLALDREYGKITHYQHDVRLLEIEGRSGDQRALLDLKFRYNEIGEYDYSREGIILDKQGAEREVALLDLDLRFDKITARQHAKAVATARDEPWVGIVGDEYDLNQGTDGFSIELDWNQQWVTYLKLNGYVGRTDSEIVDAWFMDVCRGISGEDEATEYSDFPPEQRRKISRLSGRRT